MAQTQIRGNQITSENITPNLISTNPADTFVFPGELKIPDDNKLVLGNSDNASFKFNSSRGVIEIDSSVSFEDGAITAQDGANLNISLNGDVIVRFDHVSNGGPATGLNMFTNPVFDAAYVSFTLGTSISDLTTGQSQPQVVLNSNSAYFNYADVDFDSSDWDAFNFTPNAPANGIGIIFAEDKATYIGRHNNNLGLFGAPNIFLHGDLTLSSTTVTADIALIADNKRGNNVILIDASSNNVTVTLNLNSNTWWYYFKRVDSSVNTVIISAPTDLIDGVTTYELDPLKTVELLSDGTTWQILGTNSSETEFPLLAPDGTNAAPSYSFENADNYGIWFDSVSNGLSFAVDGKYVAGFFESGTNTLFALEQEGLGEFSFRLTDEGLASIYSDPFGVDDRLEIHQSTEVRIYSTNSQIALTSAQLSFSTNAIEAIRIDSTQSVDFLQHEAKNLVVHLLASNPVSPVEGQIWYNTTTKQWVGYNGTINVVLG